MLLEDLKANVAQYFKIGLGRLILSQRFHVRYVIDISYKGTAYAGWQFQNNALTVQEVLQKSLQTLLRTEVSTLGAGRTDAGVHGTQLPVHFDLEQKLPKGFRHSLNGILPADISVDKVYRPQNDDFHTRFDALSRTYRYQVVHKKSPFYQDRALWVRQDLDFNAMEQAAKILLEFEDFASFCKAHGNNRTTLCQIEYAYWEQMDEVSFFHIRANRFLRGMVRGIVGTLIWIGSGKLQVGAMREILVAKDRSKAGPSVDAKGLFLTNVAYPEGALIEIDP